MYRSVVHVVVASFKPMRTETPISTLCRNTKLPNKPMTRTNLFNLTEMWGLYKDIINIPLSMAV